FVFALKMIGPAQKRVGFGRRMQIERRLIELDGAIVVAFHLRLIGILQDFPSLSKGLLIHAPFLSPGSPRRLRYKSPISAWGKPVLLVGAKTGNFGNKQPK